MGDSSHEEQLSAVYQEIKTLLREVDREADDEVSDRKLREVSGKMTECKRIIREFEKQATADGLDKAQILRKKTDMVTQLNKYVAQRKKRLEVLRSKAELLATKQEAEIQAAEKKAGGKGKKGKGDEGESSSSAAARAKQTGGGQNILDTMDSQQLMTHGRALMNETDTRLDRTLQKVNETIEVGTVTVGKLQEQTQVMEGVINELDEIEFSIKKARKMLTDMTKSMATDKCIMAFLLLIIGGIVTIIVLKVMKVKILKNVNISLPLPTQSPPPAPSADIGGRRMLEVGAFVPRRAAGRWQGHEGGSAAGEGGGAGGDWHSGGLQGQRWLQSAIGMLLEL